MKHRLIRFMHEHLPDVLLVLSAVAIFVTVRRLIQFAESQGNPASELKDITDVAGSILGMLLAVVGTLAAYRRFLKGRVFATRAKLQLTTSPIRWLDAEGDLPKRLMHSADVLVENVGDRTLWEPEIVIQVKTLDNVRCDLAKSTDGVESALKPGGLHGIEPGEEVAYHYRFAVPEQVPVFKITTELVIDARHAWHRASTVANCFEPSEEQPSE